MKYSRGEVSIMLVIIVMLLVTLTTAAVALAVSTLRDTTTYTLGEKALAVAESGAENAILRILRDPSYTGENNLPIGDGTATITIVGTGPTVITSTGVVGSLKRQVQVTVTSSSGRLAVSSWKEL